MAWRQFRPQAIVGAAAVLVVLVVLAITGPMLSHDYHEYLKALSTCSANGCDVVRANFLSNFPRLRLLGTLLIALPALLGAFWGAPLVTRELESGTHRLAWSQSVSRTRWIVTKLVVVGVAAMLAAGLFALAFSWWSAPLDHVQLNRFSPAQFDQRGVVPIGYAAFGFAFGVAAGVVLRRTLAAMSTTLVGFTAFRMAEQYWVRQHLYAPVHKVYALSAASGIGFNQTPSGVSIQAGAPDVANAWVYSSRIVDAAGHSPTTAAVTKACPALNTLPGFTSGSGGAHHAVRSAAPAPQAFGHCVNTLSATYHLVAAYQPASRFWLFQWTELALFVALAAALAGFTVWWVRRRLR